MTGAAGPRELEGGNGWYVYGVVAADETSAERFGDVRGVNPEAPVVLIAAGGLAAIATEVPLTEFGEEAIAENLRAPDWLEKRIRAHENVLEAGLEQAPVVPFRFGTIFRSEDHVRRMLGAHPELSETLERLLGTVELGVKGLVDPEQFSASRQAGGDEPPETGTAYLHRKQLDRRLEEERASFKAQVAQESHERLTEAAEDGQRNPLQRPELSGHEAEMFLNGAYLVRSERTDDFRAVLGELEARYRADGVEYVLTGPWPPYNFVDLADPGE